MGMVLWEIVGFGILWCYEIWVLFGDVGEGFFFMLLWGIGRGDFWEDVFVGVIEIIVGWFEIVGIENCLVLIGWFEGCVWFCVVKIFWRSLVFIEKDGEVCE